MVLRSAWGQQLPQRHQEEHSGEAGKPDDWLRSDRGTRHGSLRASARPLLCPNSSEQFALLARRPIDTIMKAPDEAGSRLRPPQIALYTAQG